MKSRLRMLLKPFYSSPVRWLLVCLLIAVILALGVSRVLV